MHELARLVIKRLPENRNMQLVCLRIASPFCCSRCQKTKRSSLVAVVAEDWNRLLCDGCYRKVLSQAPEDSTEDVIPKAWLGAVVSLRDAEKDNLTMGVPFGNLSTEWEDFKSAIQEGDEVCEFSAPADAQHPVAGQAGYALLRSGAVVKYIVTARS